MLWNDVSWSKRVRACLSWVILSGLSGAAFTISMIGLDVNSTLFASVNYARNFTSNVHCYVCLWFALVHGLVLLTLTYSFETQVPGSCNLWDIHSVIKCSCYLRHQMCNDFVCIHDARKNTWSTKDWDDIWLLWLRGEYRDPIGAHYFRTTKYTKWEFTVFIEYIFSLSITL